MKKLYLFLVIVLFSVSPLFAKTTIKSVDFTISKIALNKNYSTPSVWDTEVWFDVTIKNIWLGGITLDDSRYITLKCTDANGNNFINEKLDYWTYIKNKSLTYKEILVTEDDLSDGYLFPNAQSFQIKCKITVSWIKETSTKNNTKNFSFKVIESNNDDVDNQSDTGQILSSNLPDLIINDIQIKDWKDFSINKNYTNINDQDDYLIMNVKNIWNWVYDPSIFATNNYIYFECYSDIAWEWWDTAQFEAWKLSKWDWQAVIFPNSLFKGFLNKAWNKTINCYINYKNWMKDKSWNDIESNYKNNVKQLIFQIK